MMAGKKAVPSTNSMYWCCERQRILSFANLSMGDSTPAKEVSPAMKDFRNRRRQQTAHVEAFNRARRWYERLGFRLAEDKACLLSVGARDLNVSTGRQFLKVTSYRTGI